MTSKNDYQGDVVVAGAGIAGLIVTLKLLDMGKKIILLDRSTQEQLGGLALEAAGGIHLIDTPEQRRMGIQDTPELALQDWYRFANFNAQDIWPKRWAEFYCYNSIDTIYEFIQEMGVS
ncbi:MAG: FAD-binding protein, partial [Candidatus Berkiella sp.]